MINDYTKSMLSLNTGWEDALNEWILEIQNNLTYLEGSNQYYLRFDEETDCYRPCTTLISALSLIGLKVVTYVDGFEKFFVLENS